MAESIHSKSNTERIEEAIAKLTSNQLHYTTTQNHVTAKLDELLQRVSALKTTSTHLLLLLP